MGQELLKWADAAMYEAQPILREEGVRLRPRVFLLSATPDPLGNLAADARMYRGDPVYSLDEISDDERRWAWDQFLSTRLDSALEGIQMKFMIEAVTRSFTHQMVRQRVGAYYVQESLRFAVKKGLANETILPPSIVDHSNTEPSQHPPKDILPWTVWNEAIKAAETAYEALVNAGIPAEDARGILPHSVATRLIYTTNLRALLDHAGNRLCTQAQFEWRAVFLEIMRAMREHSSYREHLSFIEVAGAMDDAWQWELIGSPNPKTFAPICYKTGRCEFKATFDRGCSIRGRVDAFERKGVPSEAWAGIGKPRAVIKDGVSLEPIQPEEWLMNPFAGMTTEDNRPV
jgi:flavin-dependent thymidylate synthase